MKEKRLRFAANLVPLILSGEKTVTWRMFDDKNLEVGDRLIMVNRDNDKVFARADIIDIITKKLGAIDVNDANCMEGHEKYKNQQEMLATYRGYYGDKVNDETRVKIIKFKVVK